MAFWAVSTQAQDPAPAPSASSTPAPNPPAPDYADMLTKALDEGFEGFQKAEPATPEEFRD